ncbi:MAG TPA: M24 family metallopeptidase, partial [Rectinemataceae bacterium]
GAEEVAELEAAVDVSAAMHLGLLGALRPGWTEKQAAAFVASRALSEGCSLSFAPIATLSGHVLHNRPGDASCSSGGFFLLDAGAERPSGYAGDLTTSFPVGPRFDSRRAELYDILLGMFRAATEGLGPGTPFLQVHLRACIALAEGLKSLGILTGDPRDAVAEGAHALFFPHGIGHMIGLDVHDMEGMGEDAVGYGSEARSTQFGLRSLRLAKPLAPGMVHSIEPGIYFIPWLIAAWKKEGRHSAFIDYDALEAWKSLGGMRIEEDWLVMESGARRLGKPIDKSRKAIEAFRGG